MKRTPIKPGAPPRRATPLKANRKRARVRNEKAFGSKAAWVRTLPCVVGVSERFRFDGDPQCEGGMEASHVKSRGAGGTSKDLAPMCAKHHHRFHQWGRATFAATYNLDLPALAAQYEAIWQRIQEEA